MFKITFSFFLLIFIFSCDKANEKSDAKTEATKYTPTYTTGENLVKTAKMWIPAHDKYGSFYDTANAILNDSIKRVKFTLAKKDSEQWPYIELISTIGENLEKQKGAKLTYSCTAPLIIKLSQNDFNDKGNKTYSHYQFTVPASDTLVTVTTLFKEYKQPTWTPGESRTIPLKLENVDAIYFTPELDDEVGGEAELSISELYLLK